jgi:hypothetical protein
LHVKANRLGVSVAGGAAASRGRQLSGGLAAEAVVADAGTDLAQVTLPTGESVGYQLQGGTVTAPTVDGPTAGYRDILPRTDVELTTFDAGVKETLVLRSPEAASSWVFPLRLKGLTPRLTAQGSVELLNADGKAVAWFPHGSMQDSKVDPKSGAPAESDKVTFEVVTLDGAPALKVVADQAWLRDPARQYPVRIDATATTGTTGDVYVDNDASTTNHNGDNLPVGTYNGGTVKARSFIHLDEFDNNGLLGKRFSAASLKLYHTWSYDCATHKPFYVHRTTQSWTVADLSTASYPGPTILSSIGSLTISDNNPACTNSSADRTVGKWVTVPLNVDTFNDWSTGGANEGLALTASETDSYAWKRFTSANFSSGAYKQYVDFTYTNNVAPQVNLRYPANNAVVQTLTPELLSRAVDSDNWPAKGLTYNYIVKNAETGTQMANSGWVTTPSWTVPATVSGDSDVYAASVLGAKPADYWRLGEVDVTDAVNEVEAGTATFSNATLGVAGPFSDSKAASFDGSSSYLQLPPEDVPTTGPQLGGDVVQDAGREHRGRRPLQLSDRPDLRPHGGRVLDPVGLRRHDGKLRGGLWTGSSTRVITSAGAVNDNKWHHVVLSAASTTQLLYLDGCVGRQARLRARLHDRGERVRRCRKVVGQLANARRAGGRLLPGLDRRGGVLPVPALRGSGRRPLPGVQADRAGRGDHGVRAGDPPLDAGLHRHGHLRAAERAALEPIRLGSDPIDPTPPDRIAAGGRQPCR